MKICPISFEGSKSNNNVSNIARTLVFTTALVPAISNGAYNININDQVRRDYFVRNFIQRNSVNLGNATDINKELLKHDIPNDKRKIFDFNEDGYIDIAEKMSYGEYLELKKFDKNDDDILDCSAEPRVIYVCGEERFMYKGKEEVIHAMRAEKNDSHEVMSEDLKDVTKFMTERERLKHLKQIKFNALMDREIDGTESLIYVIKNVDNKTLISYLQERINNPDFDRTKTILSNSAHLHELLYKLIQYNKENLSEKITRDDAWFDNITAKLNIFPKATPDNKIIFNMDEYREKDLIPLMQYIRKNNPQLREKLVNQLMLRSKNFQKRDVNLSRLCLYHPYAATLLLTPDKSVD